MNKNIRSGFSLLELLVSIVVIGMIVATTTLVLSATNVEIARNRADIEQFIQTRNVEAYNKATGEYTLRTTDYYGWNIIRHPELSMSNGYAWTLKFCSPDHPPVLCVVITDTDDDFMFRYGDINNLVVRDDDTIITWYGRSYTGKQKNEIPEFEAEKVVIVCSSNYGKILRFHREP